MGEIGGRQGADHAFLGIGQNPGNQSLAAGNSRFAGRGMVIFSVSVGFTSWAA